MIAFAPRGSAIAGLVAGLALGWLLWHPAAPIVEPAAPAVRQGDSSLVLSRRPDSTLRPPHVIPRGTKPEREISVTVQPTAPIVHDTLWLPGKPGEAPVAVARLDAIECPAVTVNLTVVENPDHTHRVIASSPNGTVIAGVDVPLGAARAPPRTLAWSAGALYGPGGNGWGGYVSRDLGPLRLLAGGVQGPIGGRPVGLVGIGLRF